MDHQRSKSQIRRRGARGLGLTLFAFALSGLTFLGESMSSDDRPTKGSLSKSEHLVPGISRELARSRREAIKDVRYEVSFSLSDGEETCDGSVLVSFVLSDASSPLALDFAGEDVFSMTVNGEPIPSPQRVHNHLRIAPDQLQTGTNTVLVNFRSRIGQSGTALTSYRDPTDNRTYYYTLVVPADAHTLFPCFDQPDLKAQYRLTLDIPKEWKGVSNGAITREIPYRIAGLERKRILFAPTPPISTYLTAFAAGPFARIEAAEKDLALYVRQSKAKEVDAQELFRIHRIARQYQQDYFGCPLPFEKLEFVLLAGFPYGGMEHPGAIFYRESALVYDHEPSDAELVRRYTLIFHEVAHMWFGNLVTMEWFDDLWLKEGFATFVAYKNLNQVRPELRPWMRFHQTVKTRAYSIDATRGTTPVFQKLGNLKDAKSAYGAIVYNKAPAVLRQLESTLGEDVFREGVRQFLVRHRYANATWQDLVASFEGASKKDLGPWAHAWIESPGMPEVRAIWETDPQGRVAEFRVAQRGVQQEDRAWPIRLRLLAVFPDGSRKRVDVDSSFKEERVSELIGEQAPRYVVPNAEDLAYGSFLLDDHSRREVSKILPAIEDPMERTLIVSALWETVRAAQAPPTEHLGLLLELLKRETDPITSDVLLGQASMACSRYMSDSQRTQWTGAFTEFLRQALLSANTSQGLALTYFRSLGKFPLDEECRDFVVGLLNGRTSLAHPEIRQRDRWDLVGALLASRDSRGLEWLEHEKRRDQGPDAAKYAYIAKAGLATDENKATYFQSFLRPHDPPEQWVSSCLGFFNAPGQEDLTHRFLGEALSRVEWVKDNRKIFFMPAWLDAFINGQSSPEALKLVERFLANREDLAPDIRLKILQSLDGLERTVKIREAWAH